MKALIFGANGQDGFYLTELLTARKILVAGVSRNPVAGDNGYEIFQGDVTDYEFVQSIVKHHQVDYIFHLAANSTASHKALFDNHLTIATGSLNILEAVKNFSPHSKVFLSGSGLQFKNEGKPIKESDPFEARDAYSVSRIQSVYAARYYRTLGIKSYVGYFFNHDSPRRTERHIAKRIAEAVKRIAKGSIEEIEIGDLSVEKEWAYAADIMNGAITLIEQDEVFESVISSGKGYTIQDYIKNCFEFIGKDWKQYIIEKKDFTSQYKRLVGDTATIFSLGWKPEKNFDDLVKMMLES
ncbi:MAG: GDP-mannose 4,6-dehydratase [Ginsengibacter sp.]